MILTITDWAGGRVSLEPKVELYSVRDFMGKELPGLAIVLDKVGSTPDEAEEYAVLTVSFGDFLSLKNGAYIDTNNCYFADQLLRQGIAEDTGFSRHSGFCQYPLWRFKEEFLKGIGGDGCRCSVQQPGDPMVLLRGGLLPSLSDQSPDQPTVQPLIQRFHIDGLPRHLLQLSELPVFIQICRKIPDHFKIQGMKAGRPLRDPALIPDFLQKPSPVSGSRLSLEFCLFLSGFAAGGKTELLEVFHIHGKFHLPVPLIGRPSRQNKFRLRPDGAQNRSQAIHQIFQRACRIPALTPVPQNLCQLAHGQRPFSVTDDVCQ